ncbi:MAG TPA: alpha/beta hydrolase [Flavisolibacter sp.]|jgi:pimeloyl-ACP methyl ester carboxylesterase|nr:alpha/beta hydrolase [Flavisolibacter sp.]
MHVYFISGLGADRQAFEKIKLPPAYTIHYLDWIKNNRGESLNSYAKRMAALIDTSQPFAVVGLSMGGMIATAMMPWLPPHPTILISSVASASEFPPLLKLARITRVYRFVPAAVFHKPNVLSYLLFGAKTKNEKRILDHIITLSDAAFVKWSVSAILSWENRERPKGLFHIHGDNDRILPVQYTKPDVVIKNGSHFMVWTKAREVSATLLKAISEQANRLTNNEQTDKE